MVPQTVIDAQVADLLVGVADGDDLSDDQVILLNYALRASASALDVEGARHWQQQAISAGITAQQLHEVVTLMSSSGFHTFFEASRDLASLSDPTPTVGTLDAQRRALWERYVANRTYWDAMESEIEGFLISLLHMSPEAFEACLSYAALPFQSRHVPAVTKELIGMAADACPAHQYLPGMRMHLRNAVAMGAGRRAIEHAIQVAAASPVHVGVV